ncbi:dihydrofolate reductase-like [Physella acuta]|uniref:dihydrofolate reductase-like n=1 Tax=Physella acuta TaxID=109671 RepID=UPI0027DB182E|nr:dihydrofolate reductase-like [Physella acuta]XP_059141230.1 dihydrofolate reductase-like [Physella acuta]XP_059141231.1 dihydrofolate reductase-like [Physella acuta]
MLVEFNIKSVAAICDGHRGIGKDGGLPWPFLKPDYEFYTNLIESTKDPKKKNGIITGRVGWETLSLEKKTHPKMLQVVISKSMSQDAPYCWGVAHNFDEAVRMLTTGPCKGEIETIYVLGGQLNYEIAVSDQRCTTFIITRIFQDFDSDTFFPKFEHLCHRVRDPSIDDTIQVDEKTGIKFRFEVWEKNNVETS